MEQSHSSRRLLQSTSDLIRKQLIAQKKADKIKQRKKKQEEEVYREINIDFVKRRKLFPVLVACLPRKQREKMRQDVINTTKFFNQRELRRQLQAVYKCLFLELEEDGMLDAADYFKELLRENDEIVAADDIGIAIDLKKRPDFLERIADGLKAASRVHARKDIIAESTAFLKLALSFSEEDRGILWVAEKFFLLAKAVATQTIFEGGRQEAYCCYAHGRFILNKFPSADMDEADDTLMHARYLANGRGWILENYIIQKEKNIGVFESAAALLHRILICRARNVKPFDRFLSERLCAIAKRRGLDSKSPKLIAIALFEAGTHQTENDDVITALKSFKEALELLLRNSRYVVELCEAYMHVASGYLRVGEDDLAVDALTKLGSLAVECNLQKQTGRALHLLGELYLTRRRPRFAATHFEEAFSCFSGAVEAIAALKAKQQLPSYLALEENKEWKEVEVTDKPKSIEKDSLTEIPEDTFGDPDKADDIEDATIEKTDKKDENQDIETKKDETKSEDATIEKTDKKDKNQDIETKKDETKSVDEKSQVKDNEEDEKIDEQKVDDVKDDAETVKVVNKDENKEIEQPEEVPKSKKKKKKVTVTSEQSLLEEATLRPTYEPKISLGDGAKDEEEHESTESLETTIVFGKNEIIIETSSLDSEILEEDLYEDAERSRFLNAVAAGQHRMKSYFEMLEKCNTCNIDLDKMLAWKLRKVPWNYDREEDRQIPCHCPKHNRTALDIVLDNINKRAKMEDKNTDVTPFLRNLPRG